MSRIWQYVAVFLLGSLVCYVTLQFNYFQIDTEINISELLTNGITAAIGLYIAVNLQRNINRNQNQHNFIVAKLDKLWERFNEFNNILTYDDKIELSTFKTFTKDINSSVDFLKNVFTAFQLESNNIETLDKDIDTLFELLESFTIIENVIQLENKTEMNTQVLKINQTFSSILSVIQNV